MNKDLISVIVPVYNDEKYLGECIDSVLKQSYKNFELILINDGSTDNTLSIMNKYKSLDNRIVVIDKANEGPSAARNDGLDIAKGQYISFLDSDDIFLSEDYLKLLYEKLIEYDADKAICYMTKFDDNTIPTIEEYDIKMDWTTGKTILMNKLPYFLVGNTLSYLFKKEDFDNLRFPVGHIMEDNAILHRLLLKSEKIAIVNKTIYAYRKKPLSLTRSNTPHLFYISGYYAYNDRIAYYRENNEQELLEQAIRDKKDFLTKQFIGAIKSNTVDQIPEDIRLTSDEIIQAYINRGCHVE